MNFNPFNPDQPVRIYFTTMPHWRQDGCTYFVTYRLADSIPTQVLDNWDEEKSEWLIKHGRQSESDPKDWRDSFLKLETSDKEAFEKHFSRQLNELAAF